MKKNQSELRTFPSYTKSSATFFKASPMRATSIGLSRGVVMLNIFKQLLISPMGRHLAGIHVKLRENQTRQRFYLLH